MREPLHTETARCSSRRCTAQNSSERLRPEKFGSRFFRVDDVICGLMKGLNVCVLFLREALPGSRPGEDMVSTMRRGEYNSLAVRVLRGWLRRSLESRCVAALIFAAVI